jgi:hypothetical protein
MKKYLLLLLLQCMFTAAIADDGDPGLPGGDPDVPLDGGVSLLVLAGAIYGVKRIREMNNRSQDKEKESD